MPSENNVPADLTETQRALLQSAVQKGYFKVPREVSTVELAEKHDLSSRRVSEEICRGLDVVLNETGFDG